MQTYRVPGVYFEWLDTPRAIQGTRTDIAAFVGVSLRGPLHTPVKVESWVQFVSVFGGHTATGYLAYAVEGFFTNGGATCWVVRVADPATAKTASAPVPSAAAPGGAALVLEATSPGTWADAVRGTIIRSTVDRFTLLLRGPDGLQEMWRELSMEPPSVDLRNGNGVPVLRVAVADPALWRERMTLKLTPVSAGVFTLTLSVDGLVRAAWANLTMDPASPQYAPTVMAADTRRVVQARDLRLDPAIDGSLDPFAANLRNGVATLAADDRFAGRLLNDPVTGSQFVRVSYIPNPAHFPENVPNDGLLPSLAEGTDGLASLTLNHFSGDAVRPGDRWGLATLEPIDEIRIVAMPDAIATPHVVPRPPRNRRDCTKLVEHPPDVVPKPPTFPPDFGPNGLAVLQQAMVRHCERFKDRTCVLDPPSPYLSPRDMFDWRRDFDSSYAALYYPWVAVTDPLQLTGLVRAVPPCGHVAGIYARSDLRIGVHKPPANELVEGAKDLTFAVDDLEHGGLNDAAVNVIRLVPGRGMRVMGARTLSSDTRLRYVNVRRLLIMIERSIDRSTQWTVFEPNNRDLWREIVRVSRAFLDRLWKRGMLDGATADEAFSVTCDDTTNPAAQIDAGLLVCEIGVQPPWPAEFVVIRIGKTEDGTEVLDTTGAGRG